jgi:hypothetical protein
MASKDIVVVHILDRLAGHDGPADEGQGVVHLGKSNTHCTKHK